MSATIKYKGNTIAELTETENKTLKTQGKYCEADIVVENVESGGSGLTELKCNYVDNNTTFRLLLKGVGDGEIKIDMSASSQGVLPLGCLFDSNYDTWTFNNIKSMLSDFRSSANKSTFNTICKVINFNFADGVSNVYRIDRSENAMLHKAIEELNGIVWDLTVFNNQDMSYSHFWNRSTNLREIRFARNTWNNGNLKQECSTSYSDDSIYSIAFCLNDRSAETTVYRVYLDSAIKPKLNSLYCYYDTTTEQYEQCDSTQEGAITLTNYITNIVNWTIA